MDGIRKFLERYRSLIGAHDDEIISIISIIKDHTGIMIEKDAITLEKGVLRIRTNTTMKNELFIHKHAILEKVKESGIFIHTIS